MTSLAVFKRWERDTEAAANLFSGPHCHRRPSVDMPKAFCFYDAGCFAVPFQVLFWIELIYRTGEGGTLMLQEKIGIIGAGKIGSAIVRGIIGAGLATKDQVMASDVSEALRQSIAGDLGIEVTRGQRQSMRFRRYRDSGGQTSDRGFGARGSREETWQSQTFDFGCSGCASFPARGPFGSRARVWCG